MCNVLRTLPATQIKSVCYAGSCRPRECEFVWGVNVLTRGMRNLIAMRGRSGHCPMVAHNIQDKEITDRAGLYGGSAGLNGHYEGTE